MKRISYITVLVAAFVSCSKVELARPEELAPGLNLLISLDGAPATKASGVTMSGIADLNENRIVAINYFIFDGLDDSATLICKGSRNVGEEGSSTVVVNVPLSDEDFDSMIYATGHRRLYVVANASESFSNLSTVPELNHRLLTLSNKEGKQDSFVMYGYSDTISEVAPKGNMRCATSSVSLKRVLSKVSLKVNLDKTFDKGVRADGSQLGDNEDADVLVEWTAQQDQVKVDFYGLASQSQINPTAGFSPALFDICNKSYVPDSGDGRDYYTCLSDLPYYTYPRTWSIADETKPYFLISIPWTSRIKSGEERMVGDWFTSETITCFYKVLLTGSFEQNNWYAITVALKGLGSLTPGTALEVKPLELTIADWKNSVDGETYFHTIVSFQDARVLDIPQEYVDLYNISSISIPFYTTHPCTIVSATMTTVDYSQSSMPATAPVDARDVVSIVDGKIVFNHTLNNNLNASTFDYRSLTYKIKIAHADKPEYRDELTIVQYPSLYITGSINSAGDVGSTTFINNKKGGTSGSDDSDFGTLVGNVSSANNSNPNMYVVSVATLNDYKLTDNKTIAVLGDPREGSINNVGLLSGSTQAKTAPCVENDSSRQISSYYPSDAARNHVVAPKIRIASSHGATSNMDLATAKKRCATYQEDGYPAGRWRIPTRAEIEFIMTLSNKGLITRLFGNGTSSTNYWCASGYVTVDARGSVSWTNEQGSNKPVRCVYDEWYWENSDYPTVPKNTFTWGDMPR